MGNFLLTLNYKMMTVNSMTEMMNAVFSAQNNSHAQCGAMQSVL